MSSKASGNISTLFFDMASRVPERQAIISKDEVWTFRDLERETQLYSGYLKQKGIQKGDRIMIISSISPELYKLVLAVIQIGAVAVFLDPWSDKKRLITSARIADCRALISGRKFRFLSYFLPEFRQIPIKLSIHGNGHKELKEVEKVNSDDPALITFTTGSSGMPKAANRTHGFLSAQLNALRTEIPPLKNDVALTNLPVFVLSLLADGVSVVLPEYNPRKPQEMDSHKVFKQIEKHQVKTLITSPDFLLKLSQKANSENGKCIQRIFTGGAPLFKEGAQVIRKRFSKPDIVVAYGSTEAEPISSTSISNLIENDKPGVLAGTLHPSCKLAIIEWKDEIISPNANEFERLKMPSGQIGEIIVSGPHVLREYFKNPEAQKRQKFVVDGVLWHRTGDSGYINGENLYLTGPCKYLFKNKMGAVIAPFIIEQKLQECEGIKEGTLLCDPNSIVLCFVECEEGYKETVIKKELIKREIHFDKLYILKSLPKDPRHNSKIEYAKLLERVR